MIKSGCRLTLDLFAQAQRRLSIVLFHRVLARPDPLLPDEPDIDSFERQVEWLKSGFNILSLPQAAAALRAGRLPPRALCVTFDDGYADNAVNALPVLARHGVTATFFINTAFTRGGLMWNDRVIEAVRVWPGAELDLREYELGTHDLNTNRADIADRILSRLKYRPFQPREEIASQLWQRSGSPVRALMMDATQIRMLHAAGMDIGGHTHNHPILTSLTSAEAQQELAQNKTILEEIIGQPIVSFAYPNGRPGQDYDASHVSLLRNLGYQTAVTTAPGTAAAGQDVFQLPRFTPWDRTQGRYLLRLMQNYFRHGTMVPTAAAIV